MAALDKWYAKHGPSYKTPLGVQSSKMRGYLVEWCYWRGTFMTKVISPRGEWIGSFGCPPRSVKPSEVPHWVLKTMGLLRKI